MAEEDHENPIYDSLQEEQQIQEEDIQPHNININPHQFQPQIPPHLVNLQDQFIDIENHNEKLQDQLLWVFATFISLTLYCLIQIVFTCYEIGSKWFIMIPMERVFVIGVIMQFITHAHFFVKLSLHAFQLRQFSIQYHMCPEELETFIAFEIQLTRRIRYSKLLDYFLTRNFKQTTLNKILYFWMFSLGILVWFQPNTKTDPWYILQLILPGWIISALISFLICGFIVALPFFIGYYFINARNRRRARRLSVPEPVPFASLNLNTEQPCYICLCEFEPAAMVIQLKCHVNHIFHDGCLKPWLETQVCCPICRKEIG